MSGIVALILYILVGLLWGGLDEFLAMINSRHKTTNAFLMVIGWPFILMRRYLDRKASKKRKTYGSDSGVTIRRECTKDNPFSGERKENELWTHVDAYALDEDEEGRFFKCPHCSIIIDIGPDV